MFEFRGRLRCLVILAALGVGGYYTRDYWYPRARALVLADAPAASVRWASVTPAAAASGTRIALRLSEKSGPVVADVSPTEFVSMMMVPAMKMLGALAGNPEAAVHGDTLFVRANVALTELGDPESLGLLAGVLRGRQPVVIGGRLEMAQPGLLAFHVTQLTVNELKLPARVIEKIVQRISVRARTDSVAPGAVPLPVPNNVADVHITRGRVVLYKVVP